MSKTSKLDVYAQFLEYHRLNPNLMAFFVERAREARDAGYKRIGFSYLYEMARWEFGVKIRNSAWEMNNDLRSFYPRRIMMECPDLFDFFEVRSCIADRLTGWDLFKQGRPSQTPMGTPTVIDVTTFADAEPQFITVSEPVPERKPVQKVTTLGGQSYIVNDDGEVISEAA